MKSGRRETMLGIGRNQEERAHISRCLDWLEQAKKGRPILTGFLDPGQVGLLEQVAAGTGVSPVFSWGGYPRAERCRVLVAPGGRKPDPEMFDIAALEALPRRTETPPRHRDYLGALLNLGLKREKIGDVVLGARRTCFLVSGDVAAYVTQNLSRVGRWTVSLKPVRPEAIPVTPEPERFTVSVASLRLDSVLSAGFHLSRGLSAQLIRQGRVRVNWREQSDPSCAIRVGDVISCRGQGRMVIADEQGVSRKGRVRLVIGIPAD